MYLHVYDVCVYENMYTHTVYTHTQRICANTSMHVCTHLQLAAVPEVPASGQVCFNEYDICVYIYILKHT